MTRKLESFFRWLMNLLTNDLHFNLSVSKSEQICNAVATEILIPISIFKYKWTKLNVSPIDKTSSLSDVFHCSKLDIARRALKSKDLHQHSIKDI